MLHFWSTKSTTNHNEHDDISLLVLSFVDFVFQNLKEMKIELKMKMR